MTRDQIEKITHLRRTGQGYTAIAKAVGVPKETVKSFCKRNDLGGQLVCQSKEKSKMTCPQCGGKIEQNLSAKPKRFCCAACRQAWWNSHPDRVGKKAIYNFVCSGCGKAFTAYGNDHRRYCCHACYIAARFGKPGGRRDSK